MRTKLPKILEEDLKDLENIPLESLPVELRVGKLRTRWNRWLGNKTRSDKEYWITLLDSNWMGWATKLTGEYLRLNDATRTNVKDLFAKAINVATEQDLIRLDDIYVQNKYNL